jgi:hypothetical protein
MAFDTASKSGNQYLYTGRGPLDPKSLVQTYAQLIDAATWTEGSSVVAYNGMITAVWLDPDTTKNGVYFLHDATVTNKFKAPTVTNPNNWHKLGGINDLPGLTEQLSAIKNDLEQAQADIDELQGAATVVKDSRSQFPETGISGKIYVAMQEATTYVWYNGDYLPVGDGGDNDEIQIISGGGPTA